LTQAALSIKNIKPTPAIGAEHLQHANAAHDDDWRPAHPGHGPGAGLRTDQLRDAREQKYERQQDLKHP
jgi:hypothetical protein